MYSIGCLGGDGTELWTFKTSVTLNCHVLIMNICMFVCLFSWRYNPLWLYFHSPVAGFSRLIFGVS